MNTNERGFVKILLAVIVVVLLFLGYTQWNITRDDTSEQDPDEIGRVIDDVITNPNDQEVLDDLERAGTPVVFNDPIYRRVETETDPNFLPTKNHRIGGLSFKYPPVLTLSKAGTTSVNLKHTINSPVHSDFCDFKGDGPDDLATIDDFDVVVSVRYQSIADVFAEDFEYQGEEFIDEHVDGKGNIIPDDGFINSLDTSIGDGYTYFSGVEGCGYNEYVLELDDEVTLVVTRALIPYLGQSIVEEEREKYLAINGVIDPQKEEQVFRTLLASLRYNEQ